MTDREVWRQLWRLCSDTGDVCQFSVVAWPVSQSTGAPVVCHGVTECEKVVTRTAATTCRDSPHQGLVFVSEWLPVLIINYKTNLNNKKEALKY